MSDNAVEVDKELFWKLVASDRERIIKDYADRIEVLKAALKEAGEMWIRKDNRIEALEAALRLAHEWIDPTEMPFTDYVIIRAALVPPKAKED